MINRNVLDLKSVRKKNRSMPEEEVSKIYSENEDSSEYQQIDERHDNLDRSKRGTGPVRRSFGVGGRSPQTVLLMVLLIVALVSSATAYYFYGKTKNLKVNPQKATQEEVQKITSRVGKLIVLPEGEQPTIATVTDPEKLKDQPFFGKAKSGDKVLIYTNAKKAILYDPAQHKIIEVAPLNIER